MISSAIRFVVEIVRQLTPERVPTISIVPVSKVPTISVPDLTLPTIWQAPENHDWTVADRKKIPGLALDAPTIADLFVRWAIEHDLDREWAVDDVWHLVSDDFALAQEIDLPPRRVFLGALQKVRGIEVTYDRRVYTKTGKVKGKTTFYRLPSKIEDEASMQVDQLQRAA